MEVAIANGEILVSIIEILNLQYDKCFKMLHESINEFDEQLWMDTESFDSPAWQIVYHPLYNANRHCSPSETLTEIWPKTINNLHRFSSSSSALPKDEILAHPYSQSDMLDLLDFVSSRVPGYLHEMKAGRSLLAILVSGVTTGISY